MTCTSQTGLERRQKLLVGIHTRVFNMRQKRSVWNRYCLRNMDMLGIQPFNFRGIRPKTLHGSKETALDRIFVDLIEIRN